MKTLLVSDKLTLEAHVIKKVIITLTVNEECSVNIMYLYTVNS